MTYLAGCRSYAWAVCAGQGARAIVGFKKLDDAASAQSTPPRELVEGSRLVVSFGIGFVVGALAATRIITDPATVTPEQVLGIAGAGYAGADFLEGFISRQFGAADGSSGDGAVGTGATPVTSSAVDADGYGG